MPEITFDSLKEEMQIWAMAEKVSDNDMYFLTEYCLKMAFILGEKRQIQKQFCDSENERYKKIQENINPQIL